MLALRAIDAMVTARPAPAPGPRAAALWRQRLRLRPGWPLTATLVGYPLWWILGIAAFVPLICAGFMVAELARDRQVRVRRSFGLLLLFLAWVLIGVLLLQVNAVGAEPGGSSTRYLTFAYRLAWYLTAIIALVYVYNRRSVLSTERIVRAFAALFVTVVVGGVLGTVAYQLKFPSVAELVLPHAVSHLPFVHDLIHPTLAQIYTDQGFVNPRASAPFAYTNDWGLNFSCLLPFFLLGWLGRDAGWRRRLAPVVLVVAAYPVVMTQNRGAWITLALLAVVFVARELVFGRLRAVAAVGLLALTIAGVLLVTPLGSTINQRLNGPTSNQGRSSLGQRTLDSVLDTAPVVGVGTTRNVQGALYSIAGGDSAVCHNCSPPALGTQGHFWLLIYSTGLGGTILYLGFLLLQLFRYARLPSTTAAVGMSLIVVQLTTMFVYDSIDIALLTIFVGIALLWREARAYETFTGAVVRDTGEIALSSYFAFVRAQRVLLVACLLLGAVGGLAYDRTQGRPTVATAQLLTPVGPDYLDADIDLPPQSLDTIAQLINTPAVVGAVERASGETVVPGPKRLWVTATANSRLLQVHFASQYPVAAQTGVDAAAAALLATRANVLATSQHNVVTDLTAQSDQLLATVVGLPNLPASSPQFQASLNLRSTLLGEVADLSTRIDTVSATPVSAGAVIGQTSTSQQHDRTLIYLATGLGLGLLVGVFAGLARQARVGRRRGRPYDDPGLAVLATYDPAAGAAGAATVAAGLDRHGIGVLVGVDRNAQAAAIAHALQPAGREPAGRPRAAVVVERRTDGAALRRTTRSLRDAGLVLAGLIVIEAAPATRRAERAGQSRAMPNSRTAEVTLR